MSEPTATPPPASKRQSSDLSKYAQASASALIARVHPVLLAMASVLTVCVVLGGFAVFLLSSAAAQTEQQISPIRTQQNANIAARVAMLATQAEFQARVERKFERQDEKQDLILDALRVPLWKRPESRDGGH